MGWPALNLVELFLKQVETRPNAAAIITPKGRVVTYAQLAKSSATRALIYQKAGIGAGDAVLSARRITVEI